MERLLAYMEKEQLDGMFISRPVNVRYVSHYTGADSWLFITRQERFFITDPRYTEQVSMECPDYTILNWRDEYGSVAKAVAAAAKKCGVRAIGFEEDVMTVEQYREFQDCTAAERTSRFTMAPSWLRNLARAVWSWPKMRTIMTPTRLCWTAWRS